MCRNKSKGIGRNHRGPWALVKEVNKVIESMSEDEVGLDFECTGVWVTVADPVVEKRGKKKWFCTCDSPSWIPPEITVRF